jgi:putrescine transport system permease protein
MKLSQVFQPKPGRRFVIAVPYVWLLVFFVLPFLILLRISVTDMGNGVDPFAPLVEAVSGSWRIMLRYQNYTSIFIDSGQGADAGGLGNTIYMPTRRR